MRTMTIGLLTPFYFIRTGSLVALPVLVGAPLIFLLLLGGKIVFNALGLFPVIARFRAEPNERWYYTLLMSTGLTFGTISALSGLSHGIITRPQYSFLVAAGIASALVPTMVAGFAFVPRHLLAEAASRPRRLVMKQCLRLMEHRLGATLFPSASGMWRGEAKEVMGRPAVRHQAPPPGRSHNVFARREREEGPVYPASKPVGQLRRTLHAPHHGRRTEQSSVFAGRRDIVFHSMRHPAQRCQNLPRPWCMVTSSDYTRSTSTIWPTAGVGFSYRTHWVAYARPHQRRGAGGRYFPNENLGDNAKTGGEGPHHVDNLVERRGLQLTRKPGRRLAPCDNSATPLG